MHCPCRRGREEKSKQSCTKWGYYRLILLLSVPGKVFALVECSCSLTDIIIHSNKVSHLGGQQWMLSFPSSFWTKLHWEFNHSLHMGIWSLKCVGCWWVHQPRLQAEFRQLQQTGCTLINRFHCLLHEVHVSAMDAKVSLLRWSSDLSNLCTAYLAMSQKPRPFYRET